MNGQNQQRSMKQAKRHLAILDTLIPTRGLTIIEILNHFKPAYKKGHRSAVCELMNQNIIGQDIILRHGIPVAIYLVADKVRVYKYAEDTLRNYPELLGDIGEALV